MATAAPFYRVPVVIFAVLVGGLYVYAKAGGPLFGSRPHVTPATNANDEELAPPQIEFMMGPKSAPAFEELPARSTVYATPVAKNNANNAPASRPVLGGSKSRAVIEPSDMVLQQPTPQQQSNAASQRRLMPGSKSAILIDPSTLAPAQQAIAPPTNSIRPRNMGQNNIGPSNVGPTNIGPTNAAPPRTNALPGSKSMILIDPASLVPAQQRAQPQLPANQIQRPANQPRNSR